MYKPKILVTAATGHTGSAVVQQLLQQGFPVRAFVRQSDARAKALESAGAEIVVGNLLDFRDLRKALSGIQRAYHCPPFTPNLLHGAMLFASAAVEAKLEVVALMSQWHPHPADPSFVTREHWIANQLYRWMPSVDVIHINPGLFAFVYMLGLPAILHLGVLMAPFGEGRNAPPANEDIARVATNVLVNPAPHIGKCYRPTGPELLNPTEIAAIYSSVLGRKVSYRDVPFKSFSKAAKALGFPLFEIAQLRHYADALRNGVFEVGAPTSHVEEVTGHPPETFENTAKRYFANPELIHHGLSDEGRQAAFAFLAKMMLTPAPDLERWENDRDHPLLNKPLLASANREWLASAQRQQLHLLPLAGDAMSTGSLRNAV